MSSPIFSGSMPVETSTAPESEVQQQTKQTEEVEKEEMNQPDVAANASQEKEAAPEEDSVLKAAEAAKAKQAAPIDKKKTPEPKKEEPPQPKKYKIKVDGSEEELDEETIVKLAQLGRASNKRFQEAAQTKKQAEDFINLLKRDPRKVLTDPAIGLDLKKFAEDYLIEQMEQEKLTPEQIKIKELEAFKAQVEAEKIENEKKREQEEFKRLQDHYSNEYEQKIQTALSSSGLPRTAYTVKRMAEYMSMALSNNIDLEPKNVVDLVRADYQKDIMALIGQTDGDSLLQILGEPTANKIRKADLARLKSGVAAKPTAPAAPKDEQPRNPETKRFMSTHEWREWQEKQRNS